jgi:hypothetical protein
MPKSMPEATDHIRVAALTLTLHRGHVLLCAYPTVLSMHKLLRARVPRNALALLSLPISATHTHFASGSHS